MEILSDDLKTSSAHPCVYSSGSQWRYDGRRAGMKQINDLTKLYTYRDKLAQLVIENDAYSPVFLRIEKEISIGEQLLAVQASNDMLTHARLIATSQRAIC